MKLLSRLTLFGGVLALLVPTVVFGAQARSGEDTLTIASDRVINDDLYVAAGTLTVAGTINGDLVAAAGTLNVEGTVTGDVWVTGGTVNVSGAVGGDLRTAGGTVNVNGRVGKDVLVAGGTVTIARAATVGQDLWVSSGTLNVDGTVGRDLKIGSGDATIGGAVKGNIKAHVDGFRLASGSQVLGNISYTSSQELNRDATAQVGGVVNFTKQQEEKSSLGNRLSGQLYWFLTSVLLLLAILLYGRRGAMVAADFVTSKPWWSLLWGSIFVIVTPIVAFIVLITIVGFPLSVITIGLYLLALYAAKIVVSLAVGHALIRRREDRFWLTFGAGVLGLVIYYLLAALPLIGGIVTLLTLLFGIGAGLQFMKQFYADNRKKYGV